MASFRIWLSILFSFIFSTWDLTVIIKTDRPLLTKTNAMPPPSPVECDRNDCTLYNAYGVWDDRKDCRVQSVMYPETEEELLLAVAEANKKELKVKINMTVTVDSGVGLRNLIDKVEEAGLSLVGSPYWEGLSIGGILSTGAHGRAKEGQFMIIANGLRNNDVNFTRYPVVGSQGRMQASGSCLYSPKLTQSTCVWDRRIKGLFFLRIWSCISSFKIWRLHSLKHLRAQELDSCGIGPIPANQTRYKFSELDSDSMRFVKTSNAYLGQSEDSVAVDFTYYRANDPLTPRMNKDKYPKFSKFLEAKKVLDPGNMFSTELLDEIVFGKETANFDGCAMEGQCICSDDTHCNPRLRANQALYILKLKFAGLHMYFGSTLVNINTNQTFAFYPDDPQLGIQ
ncbi:hypothetical protein MKW94_004435 [Papaver nudicaule]|uniref:L-gulonolactone oxidase 2-like C-terminal domain-containing protein n=1 Tax=Papaver nudicaule TaxID=74823 RepID=A0AA41RPD6_PAPNU|nr:hypothetical protein [Papaver nudicaule]